MIAHSMELFTLTLQLAACTLPTNLQTAIREGGGGGVFDTFGTVI